MAKSSGIFFEVRCSECGFFELWGMERIVRALTQAGKLSPMSDFDPFLFAELLFAHQASLFCPDCRNAGTLAVRKGAPDDWSWDDAVRCEECQREIPEERLRAVPGVTRCVACQREMERLGS